MKEREIQNKKNFNKHMKDGELINFLNDMVETYYEHKDALSGPAAIYGRLVELIERIKKDETLFKEMETTVNILADKLIKRFREQYPKLKEQEVKLFTFIVMRFSPISIGVVLGKTPEQIYRMKYRLKHKIMESDATDKEIFLKYMK